MHSVGFIEEKNIEYIVEIHKKAFKDFFLTQLGDSFLKVYYSTVMHHENGILLGLFDNNELIGFCAATSLCKRFYVRLIKSNILSYSIIGLKLFFTKPKTILRLVRNFTKRNPSVKDSNNYAELLSIGVDPNIQGKGIGKQLLLELEKQLAKVEVKQLSLTTDYYNNEKALGFYKSLGYEIMYEFTAYPNRKMYRLIKQL